MDGVERQYMRYSSCRRAAYGVDGQSDRLSWASSGGDERRSFAFANEGHWATIKELRLVFVDWPDDPALLSGVVTPRLRRPEMMKTRCGCRSGFSREIVAVGRD